MSGRIPEDMFGGDRRDMLLRSMIRNIDSSIASAMAEFLREQELRGDDAQQASCVAPLLAMERLTERSVFRVYNGMNWEEETALRRARELTKPMFEELRRRIANDLLG